MTPRSACDRLGPPTGFLPACLLLLIAEGTGHGYELVERLRELSVDVGDPSHVYRVLRSLEAEELTASSWTTKQGRGAARRVYRLTPSGWRSLERCGTRLEELGASVEQYLCRFQRTKNSVEDGLQETGGRALASPEQE